MDDNPEFPVFSFFEDPSFIYHDFFTGLVGNPNITHCYSDRTIYLYTFIVITCVIVSCLNPWCKGKTFVIWIIKITANKISQCAFFSVSKCLVAESQCRLKKHLPVIIVVSFRKHLFSISFVIATFFFQFTYFYQSITPRLLCCIHFIVSNNRTCPIFNID